MGDSSAQNRKKRRAVAVSDDEESGSEQRDPEETSVAKNKGKNDSRGKRLKNGSVKEEDHESEVATVEGGDTDRDEDENSDEDSDDDEVPCCICGGENASKSNPIIYCDGKDCNIAIHKSCYKVEKIPEGDYFCRRCEARVEVEDTQAICCPQKDGAFFLTEYPNKFCHVVCARWTDMDMQSDIVKVPQWLFDKKECEYCKSSKGIVASCRASDCKKSFHVTCAVKEEAIELNRKINRDRMFCSAHCQSKTIKRKRRREKSEEEDDEDEEEEEEEKEVQSNVRSAPTPSRVHGKSLMGKLISKPTTLVSRLPAARVNTIQKIGNPKEERETKKTVRTRSPSAEATMNDRTPTSSIISTKETSAAVASGSVPSIQRTAIPQPQVPKKIRSDQPTGGSSGGNGNASLNSQGQVQPFRAPGSAPNKPQMQKPPGASRANVRQNGDVPSNPADSLEFYVTSMEKELKEVKALIPVLRIKNNIAQPSQNESVLDTIDALSAAQQDANAAAAAAREIRSLQQRLAEQTEAMSQLRAQQDAEVTRFRNQQDGDLSRLKAQVESARALLDNEVSKGKGLRENLVAIFKALKIQGMPDGLLTVGNGDGGGVDEYVQILKGIVTKPTSGEVEEAMRASKQDEQQSKQQLWEDQQTQQVRHQLGEKPQQPRSPNQQRYSVPPQEPPRQSTPNSHVPRNSSLPPTSRFPLPPPPPPPPFMQPSPYRGSPSIPLANPVSFGHQQYPTSMNARPPQQSYQFPPRYQFPPA
ncbi:hypothetical protein BJ742DRAFT_313690 [Cladochytrium replicatum]|nr:hypothetical protein BJ742DRAFT_313690 [Cladochytrium replicatum]